MTIDTVRGCSWCFEVIRINILCLSFIEEREQMSKSSSCAGVPKNKGEPENMLKDSDLETISDHSPSQQLLEIALEVHTELEEKLCLNWDKVGNGHH